jgi:hypothetical protein
MKVENLNFEEFISKNCSNEHIFFDYVHLISNGTRILANQVYKKL